MLQNNLVIQYLTQILRIHKLYKNEIKIFKNLKKTSKIVYSFPINKKEISATILADQNNLKKIIK